MRHLTINDIVCVLLVQTEWGGTFVQNPRQGTTTMLIAGKESLSPFFFPCLPFVLVVVLSSVKFSFSSIAFKVKLQAEKDTFDIIRYNWILDSVSDRRRLPFLKKYVIHATAPTQVTISKEVDGYGDQYIVPANRSSLLDTFTEVRKLNVHPFVIANVNDRQDYKESGEHKKSGSNSAATGKKDKEERAKRTAEWKESEDKRLLGLGAPSGYQSKFFEFDDDVQDVLASPYTMFRRYVVYVDRFTKPGDLSTAIEHSRLDMTASVVRLFGGEVSDLVSSTITHVIFNDDELGPEGGLIRLDEIKRTLQG
jgi:hypothetical protein